MDLNESVSVLSGKCNDVKNSINNYINRMWIRQNDVIE